MRWGQDRQHTHRCSTEGCVNKVLCDGEFVRNYDGIPPVICLWFHESLNGVMFCEACEEQQEAARDADLREQEADEAREAAEALAPTGTDPRRI